MFRVEWKKVCWECKNPIQVKLEVEDFRTFFYLRNFATHLPFCMLGNVPMIKYYGNMKCRRVCFGCYISPRKHFDYLRQREIGKVRKLPDRIYSKTREQIYEWFKDFDAYRKRKDINDCLMPNLGHVLGLNIYILGCSDSDDDSDESEYD